MIEIHCPVGHRVRFCIDDEFFLFLFLSIAPLRSSFYFILLLLSVDTMRHCSICSWLRKHMWKDRKERWLGNQSFPQSRNDQKVTNYASIFSHSSIIMHDFRVSLYFFYCSRNVKPFKKKAWWDLKNSEASLIFKEFQPPFGCRFFSKNLFVEV